MHRTDQAPPPPTDQADIAVLAERAVADLARALAEWPPGPGGPADRTDRGSSRSEREAPEFTGSLARLHVLSQLHRAVERCAEREAQAAAHAGAGYPQLGHAWGISRQGARRRWPGLAFTARHAARFPLRPGDPT